MALTSCLRSRLVTYELGESMDDLCCPWIRLRAGLS